MVASASAFLRIGLIQQLRRRRSRMVALEAATVAEAMRILAGGGIDMAIVDDALTVPPAGDRLVAMIERQPGRTLVIATHQQREVPPTWADRVRVIQGVIDGVLDMGAIARALPAALDEVAVDQDLRRAGPRNAPIVVDQAGRPLRGRPDIILVAASTGGPSALTALLRHLGPLRLPLVIAQHMPADQTAGFAQYLAAESGLQVIERGDGPLPPSAQVTVLHGGSDYRLTCGRAGQLRLVATAVAGNVFHPSADLLFGSAAEAGVSAIAVVLSGMGEDGARGAAAIAAQGGRVLVQDYLSCIVAGMPQATRAACPSAAVADVAEIAERLARWSRALIPRAAAMVGG
ncbi:chemotaxis protein CheB [Bradyrhizobium sp.]|jgi:chemotaxis response regulator CheB|uniref:chemotaxis protein CheB n=1 Tax=Bradyrhizobium sp. TaxID=376 RepID=UPI003C1EE54A